MVQNKTSYIFTCENCYSRNDKSASIVQMISNYKNNDEKGMLMGMCIGCGDPLPITIDANLDVNLISTKDMKEKPAMEFREEEIQIKPCRTADEAKEFIGLGQRSFLSENYIEAYEYWKSAIDWIERYAAESEIFVILLNNLGMTCSRLGQPKIALNYYLQALPLIDKTNIKFLGTTLNNIGAAYLHLEEFDNAEKYHYQAFDLHLSNPTDESLLQREKNNIIFVYNEIINNLVAEEKYSDAMKYEDKSIDVYMKTNEENSLALHNLRKGNHFFGWAELEVKRGNLDHARELILKALEMHKISDAHDAIRIYDMDLLVDIYRKMGKHKEALDAVKEMDRLAKASTSEIPEIIGGWRKKD